MLLQRRSWSSCCRCRPKLARAEAAKRFLIAVTLLHIISAVSSQISDSTVSEPQPTPSYGNTAATEESEIVSEDPTLPTVVVTTTTASTTATTTTTSSLLATMMTDPQDASVFEEPIPTYGENVCEVFSVGGSCANVLRPFPTILTNLSRSTQEFGIQSTEAIIAGLHDFQAPQHCIEAAVPLLCRYSFPTCDPAYRDPTYQPICRTDCEMVRDFLCRDAWQAMLKLLDLLDLDYLDTPDCGPLNDTEAGSSPMCISTLNKGNISLPLLTGLECYSGRGRGYQGSVNVTESGRLCQSWTDSSPHQHLLAHESYPELAGGHNFCRNPGGRGQRPWCFTTDRDQRWEYCDIPECEASEGACVQHQSSVCYGVGTIGLDLVFVNSSQTELGRLEDSMQRALQHIDTPMEYSQPCARILEEYMCVSNYPVCDVSHHKPRPVSPCRQFCERVLEVCGGEIRGLKGFTNLLDGLKVNFTCEALPTPQAGTAPECYEQTGAMLGIMQLPATYDCYNSSDQGTGYRGDANVTASGLSCQPWVSQTPHPHSVTPLDRPELEGHNYCRNPDGRGMSPWCYTTDSDTRWEYCNIPSCDDVGGNKLISLPLYAYILIAVSVALVAVAAIIILACCCRRSRRDVHLKEVASSDINGHNYYSKKLSDADPQVTLKSVSGQPRPEITDNPLYAINPLTQQPMEYDGVQLPELPREKIFYVKDLGQGHFGVVVQADVFGIEPGVERSSVAIKVLKEGASSQAKKEFFREATLMHTFDHPNILRLLGVCVEQEPLCMIFEFMELGDLNNFLRQNTPPSASHGGTGGGGSMSSLNRSGTLGKTSAGSLSSQQLVCISVDIAAGLDYLAQNHFVHRDLATRNCLVSRSLRVKIADFGLSQDVYTTDYFKMGDAELLPIRWMPPEAILYAKFTTQSDIWSFGVVLWEIFSFGIQPYFSMTNEEVVHHVRGGNVMSCPEGCPGEIYDLMVDCWVMNPEERPRASEIHAGLQRWTPDLSANIQQCEGGGAKEKSDYQNMAVVREYVEQGGGDGGESNIVATAAATSTPVANGEYLVASGTSGQFQLSMTEDSMEADREEEIPFYPEKRVTEV